MKLEEVRNQIAILDYINKYRKALFETEAITLTAKGKTTHIHKNEYQLRKLFNDIANSIKGVVTEAEENIINNLEDLGIEVKEKNIGEYFIKNALIEDTREW